MAVYAIGDIQGCLKPFEHLLHKLKFDPSRDRLWLTGDLVNRGPDSLATLRFVRDLGDSVITVLGNHDLHLLAVANRGNEALGPDDTLAGILQADDRIELLDWLRQQPLAHFDEKLNTLLVHAGIAPSWDCSATLRYAREVETMLRSESYADFFAHMYDDLPDQWCDDFTGIARSRFIINCLTRARMMDANGCFDFSHKGTLESAPANLIPWFRAPLANWRTTRIVFGHWSALGLMIEPQLIGIDTGCVWGRQLTAVRLDSELQITQVECSASTDASGITP